MKIKVCGLKYPYNIYKIASLQPDMIGFIFYRPSPRVIEGLPNLEYIKCKKVGVFVHEKMSEILKKTDRYHLDFIQLHGEESAEYCQKLRTVLPYNVGIIKAFQISDTFNFDSLKVYEKCCEFFLFDTASKNYGGSGRSFNWEILKNYELSTPFFLSGGIGMHNINRALEINHPKMVGVDVNSQLELFAGVKDTEKTKYIIQKIKSHEKIKA